MSSEMLRVTSPAAPVREQLLANLRRAIINLDFEPSKRLKERDLIGLTGASRTSVREVLRQLEAEKLIHSIPHRGTYVAVPSPEEAQELYEIRASLEGLAAGKFATKASEEEIASLRDISRKLEPQATEVPIAELRALKDSFYDTLCMHTTSAFEILRGLHARIALLRSLSLSAPGRRRQSAEEIRAMVDAIAARDSAAAADAARRHVIAAGDVALRVLAEHPEYLVPAGIAGRPSLDRF